MASFYEKPFNCNYAECIGATFFNNINRSIIKYTKDALNDILPYYCSLYKSKSGSYYCWKHLSIEQTEEGLTLFEINKKESIEKVEIPEK